MCTVVRQELVVIEIVTASKLPAEFGGHVFARLKAVSLSRRRSFGFIFSSFPSILPTEAIDVTAQFSSLRSTDHVQMLFMINYPGR